MTTGYGANHERVYRAFGKASDYLCYVCDGPARDWAWHWKDHPDPADPESYFPMCRRDHQEYDGRNEAFLAHMGKPELARQIMKRLWQDPEFRAKMLEVNRQNVIRNRNSPEFRARMAEAARQQWQDPEYQARISEARQQQARDPEERARRSERAHRQWADPEYRAKMTEVLRRNNANRMRKERTG